MKRSSVGGDALRRQRRAFYRDPMAILFMIFAVFAILTVYIYLSTSLEGSDKVINFFHEAAAQGKPNILMPPENNSTPIQLQPSLVQSGPGLEVLKLKGGSGTRLNRETMRQELGAFARNFNSSRVEDIYCPDTPPADYPKTYPMKALLDNWNTDDTDIPPFHYNSLCYFDYQTEYSKALAYRNAELPFVIRNIPEVDEVVRRWSDLNYLNNLLGPDKKYTTTISKDNHFMYYRKAGKNSHQFKDQYGKPWTKPTDKTSLTFKEWLALAVENHNRTLDQRHHYYFRVSGENPGHFIYKELPFFNPKESFFIVKPSGQRGIHCRFGMRSVISENHYDGSRNFAATFSGLRRWILNHPDQCDNLYLFKSNHPSARHSSIDWSQPDYETHERFATARSNELIVKPGDVVYLPTNWFHYIISLNINIQCNTRSGRTSQYDKYISDEMCRTY